MSFACVRSWHKADVPLVQTNVCFEGKNGHGAVATSFPLVTHIRHSDEQLSSKNVGHVALGHSSLGKPLVTGSRCIISKHVCFHLQLSKSVLENIADTDDPDELVAVLDRHMANAPLGHHLHNIGNAVLR